MLYRTDAARISGLDKRGRFNARRFDEVFGACSTVDQNGATAFTASELTKMIITNRETLVGSLVSMVEWQVLLGLAADTKVRRGKAVPALSVARPVVLRRHALLQTREGTRLKPAIRPAMSPF